jgi:GNAT superfamily N-acetyltransferase
MASNAAHKNFIRLATAGDAAMLQVVALAMGAWHEDGYFDRCLSEQAAGQRLIFAAEADDRKILLGYAQLNLNPVYPLFRRLGIPEIQDLNVIPGARRQGWGAAMIAVCEEEARRRGHDQIGIGVGLHPGFGQAQRLYIKLGYVPDGYGAVYDERNVTAGEIKPLDGLLALKMVKNLAVPPKS